MKCQDEKGRENVFFAIWTWQTNIILVNSAEWTALYWVKLLLPNVNLRCNIQILLRPYALNYHSSIFTRSYQNWHTINATTLYSPQNPTWLQTLEQWLVKILARVTARGLYEPITKSIYIGRVFTFSLQTCKNTLKKCSCSNSRWFGTSVKCFVTKIFILTQKILFPEAKIAGIFSITYHYGGIKHRIYRCFRKDDERV